jgi:hypothetical protein
MPLEKDIIKSYTSRLMFLKLPIEDLSRILHETVKWVEALPSSDLLILAKQEKIIQTDCNVS